MLINLDYWRKNNITNRCFDFIRKFPDKILWHDQDALNYILRSSKRLIDYTYNFQSQFLYKKQLWGELKETTLSRINQIITDGPIIIHYSNTDKPWIKGSMHPYVKNFLYYKNISYWKDSRLVKRHTKKSIKSILFDLLIILRIKKRPTRYLFYPLKLKK